MIKSFFSLAMVLWLVTCQGPPLEDPYVCPPCDLDCDSLTFSKPGICPHCKMTLVLKSSLRKPAPLTLNKIDIKEGSGVFMVSGKRISDPIKVYYHLPKIFTDTSSILLVIPGSGRDADEYRDDWIEISEKHRVLILSLEYDEISYPFHDYHLGSLIQNPSLEHAIEPIQGTNQLQLKEEALSYDLNLNSETWLFNDFDRIFLRVKQSILGRQETYDIYGHSAGGQILHRMAIFQAESLADNIIAANSGFYTLPDSEAPMPFGIKDMDHLVDLENIFKKKLHVLVGALDNETETRGTLLRSVSADLQGNHRLARARHFIKYAQESAEKNRFDFLWKLSEVPEVGHDHRKMASAAANLLYEN